MMRIVASWLVAAIVAIGAVPCVEPAPAPAAASAHADCEGMAMPVTGMDRSSAPAPVPPSANCCITSADARVPPTTPATPGSHGPQLLARALPTPFVVAPISRVVNDRDLRARSAPRPPLVLVLLI